MRARARARCYIYNSYVHAQSRVCTARLDYIYNLHTWRAYIDRVPRMLRTWTRTSARARAHAYTYVCARGLPAYFGILIARGRPSPLLTPSRRALRPISPHLVSYRAPAPRLHPLDTRRRVLVFPPRDVTHPENSSWQPPVAYVFSRVAIIMYAACHTWTCIFPPRAVEFIRRSSF